MVIDDLHVGHALVGPHEAQPPLVVDADAVLALAVAAQRFQPVAGRAAQEVQSLRRVQLRQLALGHAVDVGEAAGLAAGEQALRVRTLEREGRHGLRALYTV